MRVIVLAAGQGTRLRPLTDLIPKALIKFAGKSLLEYQYEVFDKLNISDVTVLSGYCAEKILKRGYRTIYNPKYEVTNMVQTLFCAEKLFDGEADIIISYGDIIFEPSVLEKLMNIEAGISVVVDKNWQEYWKVRLENPLSDAETLKINSEGYLVEIGKKPLSYEDIQGQYIGLIKISKEQVLKFKEEYFSLDKEADYDGKNFDNMYMTSFIQHLINKEWQVKPVYIEGGWLEFDSMEDYAVYNGLLNKGELGRFFKII